MISECDGGTETFFAETGAVDVRTRDLVVAGTRRGAVGPVQAGRTADGAVVTLDTKTDGDTDDGVYLNSFGISPPPPVQSK